MMGTVQSWTLFKNTFTVSYSKSGKGTAATLAVWQLVTTLNNYVISKLESVRCLWDYTRSVKGQLLSVQLPTEQQYGKEIMSSMFFFFFFFFFFLHFLQIHYFVSSKVTVHIWFFCNICMNNKYQNIFTNINIPWINLYFISYFILFYFSFLDLWVTVS